MWICELLEAAFGKKQPIPTLEEIERTVHKLHSHLLDIERDAASRQPRRVAAAVQAACEIRQQACALEASLARFVSPAGSETGGRVEEAASGVRAVKRRALTVEEIDV
jgi:cob(I)alamin adenosyltransferase